MHRTLRNLLALCLLLLVAGPARAQDAAETTAARPARNAGGDPGADHPASHPAQPDESALETARRRFARGLELAQRGDFRTAAVRFREALAIHPAPAVRFNLASALYEMGDYVASFNELVVVLEASEVAPEVRARAQVLVEALGEKIATLNVRVGGDTELRVRVDGIPLEPERLGTRFAVQPGSHRVEAYRGDTLVSRRELTVTAGTRALVDMSVVQGPTRLDRRAAGPTATSEAIGPGAPFERPADAPKRFGVRDWRLWAVVGGTVVAIAAAGVAVGMTRSGGAAAVPGDFEPTVLSWK